MTEDIHIVKRAIIMAAGKGERMRPLTLETPKPLVKVNGIRMIDTVINGLHQNGIYEIYVVVGYLKEQFYTWAGELPGIEIIENPYYDRCNNISSLYMAREHLNDCMILDGDQIINDPTVLEPVFTVSGYNAIWCEERTKEWLMQVQDDIVRSCSRIGGFKGWQLFSISRWTEHDGEKLKKHLEQEFEGGNRNIYWDDVPMFCHFSEYELGIHRMKKGDVVEVDDLEELVSIDCSYSPYLKMQDCNGEYDDDN